MELILDYLQFTFLPVAITFAITWFIGFERQNIGKSAGISPHVLISATACCLALMQQELESSVDGQRVIAQLITGVGFLGTGVIMKSHHTVKGLTTATTLFASAVIGIIIGSGYFTLGITLGFVIIFFMYTRNALRGINPFKKHHDNDPESHESHE